jgi:hypothetical protein
MAFCGAAKERKSEGEKQGRVGWVSRMVDRRDHHWHLGFSSRNGGTGESLLGFMVGMG